MRSDGNSGKRLNERRQFTIWISRENITGAEPDRVQPAPVLDPGKFELFGARGTLHAPSHSSRARVNNGRKYYCPASSTRLLTDVGRRRRRL